MELMQDSWRMFAVGERGSTTCLPLRSVGHVTHVESALEILAAGFFGAAMVPDSVGPLGTLQLKVLFTSPYDWEKNGNGYRFGNVNFMFDWRELIRGKNYYWLGAKKHSRLLRPRVLITERRHDEFKAYDPSAGDGPWWFDRKTKSHFWNGRYCIEFLLENPLLMVHSVPELKFVRGHPMQCPLGSRCFDAGHEAEKAALRMLAGMCFFGTINVASHLWKTEDNKATGALCYAWDRIGSMMPTGHKWNGPIGVVSKRAKALGRAIMGARYRQLTEDQNELLSLFSGRQAAIELLATVIEEPLGLQKGALAR